MNNSRTQDLTEAFAIIVKMMRAGIRAQGWRSLRYLPMLCLVAIKLRRVGSQFDTLMAAFKAGILNPPAHPAAPEPPAAAESWTDPADQQAGYAYSPAAPRPAARPDPAARDRQRPAERPPLPAAVTGPAIAVPNRPRAADGVFALAALPHTRGQPAIRPSRRTPDPFALLGLPAGIIATGRSP
jgi:hypothetical protein